MRLIIKNRRIITAKVRKKNCIKEELRIIKTNVKEIYEDIIYRISSFS